MKFLVDAQLPRRLVISLQNQGSDIVHTLDLPQANSTPDGEINRISISEERIVITKDADFVDSFLLQGQPYKLLLVSTGNINNTSLLALFAQYWPTVLQVFQESSFVELTREALIVHG